MEILVACPKEGDETIIGWIAFEREKNSINFIYVKDPFRGFGVAKFLFEEAKFEESDIYFTHWTYSIESGIDNLGFIYDPYLFLI